MRKRYPDNDVPEVGRPSGALKENEIEEIRQAYRDGCKGEILIGMRGEERAIAMMVPETSATDDEIGHRISDELKRLRCDAMWSIRTKSQPRHPQSE